MSVEQIIQEIFRLKTESLKLKKAVKIEVLLGKSDIYKAYMLGLPIVNDDVVRIFDSFTGFESLQINIAFDGRGGVSEKLFAIRG